VIKGPGGSFFIIVLFSLLFGAAFGILSGAMVSYLLKNDYTFLTRLALMICFQFGIYALTFLFPSMIYGFETKPKSEKPKSE